MSSSIVRVVYEFAAGVTVWTCHLMHKLLSGFCSSLMINMINLINYIFYITITYWDWNLIRDRFRSRHLRVLKNFRVFVQRLMWVTSGGTKHNVIFYFGFDGETSTVEVVLPSHCLGG